MTFNQIIKELKTACLSHRQINHFYYGQAADWAQNPSVKYPSALLESGNPSIVPGGMRYSFTLWLSDLVFAPSEDVNDETIDANTIEVQSDMIQVMYDLSAVFDDPDLSWILRGDINAETYDNTPVNEDMVAGLKATFTIDVPMAKDRRVVPVRS